MVKNPDSICVFCGASNEVAEHYRQLAYDMGRLLAEENIRLVYGAGDCGLMGAVANGALEHGGQVSGVFPRILHDIEKEHTGLQETTIVDTMHERKQLMYDRSDAFVILPGGFGTLDETFEAITWKQLNTHRKPVVILNYKGYWDHWIALTNHILAEGFAGPRTRQMYGAVSSLEEVLPEVTRQLEMFESRS